METIHEIDKKPWISKKVIHLDHLVSLRESQLLPIILDSQSSYSSDLHESDEQTTLLNERLGQFISSGEKEIGPYFLFNSTDERALIKESGCKLKTYQLQLEHAKKMISDRTYKVSYFMKLRTTRRETLMRHLALVNRSQNPHPVTSSTTSENPTLVPILVIQTWSQPSKTKAKLQREILFSSGQNLTDLRTQFKCQRDYGVPMDLSDNPDQAERIYRGELFKSGFFLIGNTFYNDMRDSNNIDLSADIISWASTKVLSVGPDGKNVWLPRGFETFESKRMEDHRFLDLKFRLGCPYLYLHQGDCEHLFTISDIRYVASTCLEHKTRKYPFITATMLTSKNCDLRCFMCKSRPPHWYTRNNNRLPYDPFFFCETCFYSFNYDKDRRKIGQFQAYLFTSASGIPDSVAIGSAPGDSTAQGEIKG